MLILLIREHVLRTTVVITITLLQGPELGFPKGVKFKVNCGDLSGGLRKV